MKTILLILCLLLAGSAKAQNQIEEWSLVRDSYFKVVVAGDTLEDDFQRLDTAERFAFDYAKNSAQGAPIEIIGANYRFEYEYLDIEEYQDTIYTEIYDTTYVTEKYPDHPYLNSVHWTYQEIPDTSAWNLQLSGNSTADMMDINTKCVGRESVDFNGVTLALMQDSFSHTMTFDCNEILTWDMRARTDTLELEPRKYFLDVALIQSLE